MERGIEFLRSQIANAAMQHRTFLDNLIAHERQADDERFRALCATFIPRMTAHQRMLEDYQRELGADANAGKLLLGKALGVARELADVARESDFLRLAGDIVEADQAEDTFKIFRDAGRQLGLGRLAEIGDQCERDHDDYHREAMRLCTQLFSERVREGDTTGLALGAVGAMADGGAEESLRTRL